MKTAFRYIVLTLACIFLSATGYGANIQLKNGKTVEGTLTTVSEQSITLNYSFGEIEFPIGRIADISSTSNQENEVLIKSGFFEKYPALVKSIKLPKPPEPEKTPPPPPPPPPPPTDEAVKKAALEAVQNLKKSLEEKYAKDVDGLRGSYEKQISFLDEKVKQLTARIDDLEKGGSDLKQKIASLEKCNADLENEISEKKKSMLSLNLQLNDQKAQLFEKDKELAQKISSINTESTRLAEEQAQSLKSTYASQIESLNAELADLKAKTVQMETENYNLKIASKDSTNKDMAAERENLEKNYSVQMQALKDENTALRKKYDTDIQDLKTEVSETKEQLASAQSQADEKLKKSLYEKDQLWAGEKTAIIKKYQAQLDALNTGLNSLATHNQSLLQTDSGRQEEMLKLQENDKTRAQTISNLQSEIQRLKEEIDKQTVATSEKIDKERSSLRDMIEASGNKLAQTDQEKKKLADSIKESNEKIASLEQMNKSLQEKIDLLTKEKETLAGQAVTNSKLKDMQNSRVIAGLLSEAAQNNTDILSGETAGAEGADRISSPLGTSTLIELFKSEQQKLQAKMQEKDNQLSRIAEEKMAMKAELIQAKAEQQNALKEAEDYRQKFAATEKEKQDIKANADNVIQQQLQQAKAELEKEKEQLRKSYDETVARLEQKAKEAELVQTAKEPAEAGETPPVQVASADPKALKEALTEAAREATQPADEMHAEALQEQAASQKEPSAEKEPKAAAQELVQAGIISDIGTDYGRVYIETSSPLNAGDIIFVKKEGGRNYEFKVIQVLPTLNGAIAQISASDTDKISEIKKNDPVYILASLRK